MCPKTIATNLEHCVLIGTRFIIATFRVARLTSQTRKLRLVGVATDRDAGHACLRFFSFCFSVFCLRFFSFCFSVFCLRFFSFCFSVFCLRFFSFFLFFFLLAQQNQKHQKRKQLTKNGKRKKRKSKKTQSKTEKKGGKTTEKRKTSLQRVVTQLPIARDGPTKKLKKSKY